MVVGAITHRFTTEEFELMVQAGVFREDDRLELVHGEIVEMTPIGSQHSHAVDRLNKTLVLEFSQLPVVVRVQNPIVIDGNTQLQPDFAIVDDRGEYYEDNIPRAGDVRLIVEVADSSVSYDRQTKSLIYAVAGIIEYWLVDLTARSVEVFRTPAEQGYQDRFAVGPGDDLIPLAFPGTTIPVDRFLRRR